MRVSLTLLLLIVGYISVNATPKKIKPSSRKILWRTAANWDLARLPQDGDTIIIPANDTVIVDENFQNLSSSTLHIEVAGALYFSGGGAKLPLGTNSVIKVLSGGIVYSSVSPSQIISIGGVSKYQGNGDAVIGPAEATRSTSGFAPVPPSVILPVTFIGFNVAYKNADVLVQWATTQELNAYIYEIERSFDGANWNTVGTVKAVGTTNSVSNYSFTDKAVSAKVVYYRIKQKDLNGDYTYTSMKSLKADTANLVKATALRGNIVLQFTEQVKGQVEVRLISLNGQVISRQIFNQPVGQFVVPAYVKGNYILTVSNNHDIQLNKQILF